MKPRKGGSTAAEATLVAFCWDLGATRVAAKDVYVPLLVGGRRWGNFELAYVDTNRG